MPPIENEPVAEDPNIVKGGPWGGPEGDAAPSAKAEETPEAPLYKGLTGEIRSVDDLKKYAATVESMLIAGRESGQAKPEAQAFTPPVHVPAPVVTEGESFEELIYSNPVKAKALFKAEILNELETQSQKRNAQVSSEQTFWDSFYQKNADLKDMRQVVQSVFKRDRADIGNVQRFPSNEAVAQHLAKEARSIIGLVKEKSGFTEIPVESKPAFAFNAGSGEPSAARSANNAKPGVPISFSQQISRLRKRKA